MRKPVSNKSRAIFIKPASMVHAGSEADAELVVRSRCGNIASRQQAFSILVTRYEGFVRAMLMGLCRQRALADDLSQEAFLSAWIKLDSLSNPASFKGWLKQLAYRQFLHQYRHAKVERKYADIIADEPHVHLQVDDDLQQMLSLCTPLEREMMILRYGFEFSNAEIGQARDMAVGTVKSHVYRAKQKMQDQLTASQYQEIEK